MNSDNGLRNQSNSDNGLQNQSNGDDGSQSQQAHGRAAALIDMDGVLYDSMKYHTVAWHRMMLEYGLDIPRDEFYLYEGMTGAATIELLWQRAFHTTPSVEQVKEMYARKTVLFNELGRKEPMPGADRMLGAFRDAGWKRVLVTGSSQRSLIDMIVNDYPGIFAPDRMVTARDVKHGKPSPEPYLKGAELAGVAPERCVVVENAPLGVRAGKAAGCLTVAVTTGPIPRSEFEREKADLIFPSMPEFADALPSLIEEWSR